MLKEIFKLERKLIIILVSHDKNKKDFEILSS